VSTNPTESLEKLLDQGTGTRLMATAIRLLAHGDPITIDELAQTAGATPEAVTVAPSAGDIEYDDHDRIVGWGLTLNPTPHRFTVDGRLLYTWCAADTLIFPIIIGRPAQVESPCPTTGATISLTVEPGTGITGVRPATAVISIPGRGELDANRVRQTGCNPGRFFANADAAADWRRQHPTGDVLSVTGACDRIRPMAERMRRAADVPPSR
jgi:alkylmercury lyase